MEISHCVYTATSFPLRFLTCLVVDCINVQTDLKLHYNEVEIETEGDANINTSEYNFNNYVSLAKAKLALSVKSNT
jgi:hypothetical protein